MIYRKKVNQFYVSNAFGLKNKDVKSKEKAFIGE